LGFDVMLDHARFAQLQEMFDSRQFAELLDVYKRDTGRMLRECTNALQREQWQHLSELAEIIKATSTKMGITGIAALAAKLAQAAASCNRQACLDPLASMLDLHRALDMVFEAELK
jgi:hypothetical protein